MQIDAHGFNRLVGWGKVVTMLSIALSVYSTSAIAQFCPGDCDGSGFVRVNELITGVNIALDREQLSRCGSFDTNNNLRVEVNELVTAVNNLLHGCPEVTSPSPTELVTPTRTNTRTSTIAPSLTPTLTAVVGTASPTGTAEEATPTPTMIVTVGTASPTGTAEEATVTPTFTVIVGTASPTGSVEEATATPTFTVVVGTASPTGTVIEITPTPLPTGTPTPTSTPIGPTAPPAARVAGATTAVVNALGVIPNVVGAILYGNQFGGATGDDGSAQSSCPGGGTAMRTGALTSLNFDVTLALCRVATANGFVTFNGRIKQTGFSIAVNDGAQMNPGPLTAQFEDTLGTPTLLAQAKLTLTLSGLPTLGGSCVLTAITVTANGTISTTLGATTNSMTFTNTTVTVNNIMFSAACLPQKYTLTFKGAAALLSSATGDPINVTFGNNGFVIVVDDSVNPATFRLSGDVTSSCFGGLATISTQQALTVLDNEVCPRAGQITATVGPNSTHVFYRSNQNVEIDTNGDNVPEPPTYPNCLDPRLYECLA